MAIQKELLVDLEAAHDNLEEARKILTQAVQTVGAANADRTRAQENFERALLLFNRSADNIRNSSIENADVKVRE